MLALTRRFNEPVSSGSASYLARAYAGTIEGGRWGGWLVFFPVGGGPVISTDRETTQPSIAALSTWAAGITPVYLEGALQRALQVNPDAELEQELRRLERLEREGALPETAQEVASAAHEEARLLEIKRDYAEERLLATASEPNAEAQLRAPDAATKARTAQAADKAIPARRKKRKSPRPLVP